MTEDARKARNAEMLMELHPGFRSRVIRVIALVEARKYRPRIQCAWRSPEDQLKAFKSGNSKLRYGFHNFTGTEFKMQSLAVDMLDDDFPLNSRIEYLVELAHSSQEFGLNTGILWGLPVGLRNKVQDGINRGRAEGITKVGWDPTHVEPAGLTIQQAQAGIGLPTIL